MSNIIKFLVTRPEDTVEVWIIRHKNEDKFSYVNLTKGHICPCKFDSIEEAIGDMDKLIAKDKIIRYEKTQ